MQSGESQLTPLGPIRAAPPDRRLRIRADRVGDPLSVARVTRASQGDIRHVSRQPLCLDFITRQLVQARAGSEEKEALPVPARNGIPERSGPLGQENGRPADPAREPRPLADGPDTRVPAAI